MLLNTLYICMVVAAIFQRDMSRMYAAGMYVLVQVIFALVFHTWTNDTSGGAYYVFAAMFDLLAIILLLVVSSRCVLGLCLSLISGTSILVNVLGFVSWYNFGEPTVYNQANIVLQSLAILLMIATRERDDVGKDRGGRIRASVRSDSDSSVHFVARGDKAL